MRRFGGAKRGTRWAVGTVLVLAAVIAGLMPWWLNHQADSQRLAAARAVPSSVAMPSKPAAPVTGGQSASAAPSQTSTPPVAVAPAPIAAAVTPIVPRYLVVPALKGPDGSELRTTVAQAPTVMAWDEFLGRSVPSFGVPPDSDMVTTTWWNDGPKPGDPGMAIVLGHTQIGAYGVFNDLGTLQSGADIFLSDGKTTLHFKVIVVQPGISKTDPTALQAALNSHPANAQLALLTCSGHFNGRESEENTIAFASLVPPGA